MSTGQKGLIIVLAGVAVVGGDLEGGQESNPLVALTLPDVWCVSVAPQLGRMSYQCNEAPPKGFFNWNIK